MKSKSDKFEKYETPLRNIEDTRIKVSIKSNSLSFFHIESLNLHKRTYKTRNTENIIGIADVWTVLDSPER